MEECTIVQHFILLALAFTVSNPTQSAPLHLKCASLSLKLILGLYTGHCLLKPFLLQAQHKRIWLMTFFVNHCFCLVLEPGSILWLFLPNKSVTAWWYGQFLTLLRGQKGKFWRPFSYTLECMAYYFIPVNHCFFLNC